MKKTQSKLKDCIEKTEMKSFDRLSETLGANDDSAETWTMEVDEGKSVPAVDASETTGNIDTAEVKGENKAAPAGRRTRKKNNAYRRTPKQTEKPERPKPKYFCAF
jgi:hypothetical protein